MESITDFASTKAKLFKQSLSFYDILIKMQKSNSMPPQKKTHISLKKGKSLDKLIHSFYK